VQDKSVWESCCSRIPASPLLLLLDPYRARLEELVTCWQTAGLSNAQRRVVLAETIVAVHKKVTGESYENTADLWGAAGGGRLEEGAC
jgi:hypothetical protein